jgi:hypothetical protein
MRSAYIFYLSSSASLLLFAANTDAVRFALNTSIVSVGILWLSSALQS